MTAEAVFAPDILNLSPVIEGVLAVNSAKVLLYVGKLTWTLFCHLISILQWGLMWRGSEWHDMQHDAWMAFTDSMLAYLCDPAYCGGSACYIHIHRVVPSFTNTPFLCLHKTKSCGLVIITLLGVQFAEVLNISYHRLWRVYQFLFLQNETWE